MLKNLSLTKLIIAGYGLPAEFGVSTCFCLGLKPENIILLTHPEDERNRGLLSLAKLRGIKTYTDTAKNIGLQEEIRRFRPDLLLSLHYRELIPGNILDIVNGKAINLHPSLLPKYRGTNSVAWVIINGETETGFTYHYMTTSFDTGDILYQEKVEINENETAFSLFHKQIVRAMAKLEFVIKEVIRGTAGKPQVGESSYYNRTLPFDGTIQPEWELDKVERFIRAMYFPPFPAAKFYAEGKIYTVENLRDYEKILAMQHHVS